MSARPQSAQLGLGVIVVPMAGDAEDLRSRIREGASFEALAVAYSVDGSASRGGYLGSVDESSLRQEYRIALRGTRDGEVSAVTRAGDTFVLLKRTTEAEDRWRSTHDSAVTALQQANIRKQGLCFSLRLIRRGSSAERTFASPKA